MWAMGPALGKDTLQAGFRVGQRCRLRSEKKGRLNLAYAWTTSCRLPSGEKVGYN